jgi:replicative DNA helicase
MSYDINAITPYIDMPSERAILGSVLLQGRYAYERVAGILSPDDFYMPRHGYIWDAFTQIEGEIDIITVATALGNRLTDAGKDAYLADLMTNVPMSEHIETYAQTVRAKSIARQVTRLIQSAQQAITQGEVDIHSIIGKLSSALTNVNTLDIPKPFTERVRDFVSMREKLWDNPLLEDGLSWGLPLFDTYFGLIKPKNLIMLAGASKSGKSLVAAHVLYHIAKSGKRVGLISLEMSDNEVLARLEEIISGVNFDEARADGTSVEHYRQLLRAWSTLYKLPIAIYDDAVTLSAIPRLIRQFRQELDGLDLLIVDYAGLIEPDNPNDRRAHWERMNEIAVTLKRIAIAENLPILSAVQINRSGFGKRPSMEHISGTIGNIQNANVVIAVWRPEDEMLEGAINIYHMANRSKKSGQEIEMVQHGLQLHLVERVDLR